MSVFFENVCKFGANCGMRFADVYDLIHHIEDKHYSVDQSAVTLRQMSEATQQQQQQVAKCALSVLSRYYKHLPERKPAPVRFEPMQCSMKRHKQTQLAGGATQSSNQGAAHGGAAVGHSPHKTPGKQMPGSARKRKLADGDSLSVTSDDRSFSARSDHTNSEAQDTASGSDAVFAKSDERRIPCPMGGCPKVYKNMNGVRYHLKIAHPNEHGTTPDFTSVARPYKCSHCPNKAYKTSAGLTNHMAQMHGIGAAAAAQAARNTNTGVTASTSGSGVAAGASQWASAATITAPAAGGNATAARTMPMGAQVAQAHAHQKTNNSSGGNVTFRHQPGSFNAPPSISAAVRKAI